MSTSNNPVKPLREQTIRDGIRTATILEQKTDPHPREPNRMEQFSRQWTYPRTPH